VAEDNGMASTVRARRAEKKYWKRLVHCRHGLTGKRRRAPAPMWTSLRKPPRRIKTA